mmetsp:Transcript_4476/g.12620  ORF Transcript_4476/g.12620 Transcript_4476/m.12620 type:complete len:142 (-) Transcript_4476:201-626(-)
MKSLRILRGSAGGASQQTSLRVSALRCDDAARLMEVPRSSSRHVSPTPLEPDLDLPPHMLSHSTTKSSSTVSDFCRSAAESESRRVQRMPRLESGPSIRFESESRQDESSSRAPRFGALRSSRFNLVRIMINTVLSRTRQK